MMTQIHHHIDRLERRTLFSGWTTIQDFNPSGGTGVQFNDVTTDASGNLYAAGIRWDSNYIGHGIVREKAAGSDTWTTILDYPGIYPSGETVWVNSIAVSPTGDLYVSGSGQKTGWVVLERPAGQSTFSVVDRIPVAVGTTPSTNADLTIDSAGNVFASGMINVVVSSRTTGNKTSYTIEHRWTVREKAVGAASFSNVDQFVYGGITNSWNTPYAMTAVSSGPGAGVYVVGSSDSGGTTPEHWIVRKSADGGATWKTIDDYQPDSKATSRAQGVTVDAAGNLYVSGETSDLYVISTSRKGTVYGANYHWVVRKSSDGGATWPQTPEASFKIPTFSGGEGIFGMGSDAAGNVYAVHPQYDSSGFEHSIVRSSAVGWQPVDDFQLAPGQNTVGFGFAAGPDGVLFTCGYGVDSGGVEHGFVRSIQGPLPPSPVVTSTTQSTPLFSTTSISESSQPSAYTSQPTMAELLFGQTTKDDLFV